MLSGKITIELLEDDGALPLIFFQPSKIESKSTHGIVENYKMKFPGLKKDGVNVYKVPTDWSVYLMYNVSDFNGGLKLRSWASPFESEDEFNSISKEFKTTRKFVATPPESEDLVFVGLIAIPFAVLLLALLGYCTCQQITWRRQLDDVEEAGNDATLVQDSSNPNIHFVNSSMNDKSFEKGQTLQHTNKVSLEPNTAQPKTERT